MLLFKSLEMKLWLSLSSKSYSCHCPRGLRLYPVFLFIHSFIQVISIAPLQVHCYSEAVPTQHGYCVGVSRRSAKGNCKVPTWWLERDSNPQPFGRKATNLPKLPYPLMSSICFRFIEKHLSQRHN